MKKLVLVSLFVVALAPAARARVRVVRHPATPCTFSLVPVWGTSPIAAAGMTRGMVFVYGQTATCAQWGAFSSVDWVTVEAAPLDAQPAAYVTVSPNPAASIRNTTVIVAGVRLELVQEGAPAVADPNLVANGSFHTGIEQWIWYDGRFPNGRGAASWSALDANGSPVSGSILLRDDGPGDAFQRLQCLPVSKSTKYHFGAKVRTGAPRERGDAQIAMVTFKTPDCSGDLTDAAVRIMSPAETGVWEDFSFVAQTGSRTQSVVLVIASAAVMPPFEAWLDDVFLRPE